MLYRKVSCNLYVGNSLGETPADSVNVPVGEASYHVVLDDSSSEMHVENGTSKTL